MERLAHSRVDQLVSSKRALQGGQRMEKDKISNPKVHVEEFKRLQDLYELNILDTIDEQRFDRITSLVSRTLGFSSVLISLIDENRQWFKSRCNFTVRETTRDISFCAHAINAESGNLVIPDTKADVRFCDNPLVTGPPNIRAYVGIVLRSPNGLPLGTLCAIDYKPMEITEDVIATLKEFASIAEAELLRSIVGSEWDRSIVRTNMHSDQIATSSAEFCKNAQVVIDSDFSQNIAVLVVDVPQISRLKKTYGAATIEKYTTELARRIRLGLSNRKYLLGHDDHRLFSSIVQLKSLDESEMFNLRDILAANVGNRIQTDKITILTPINIGCAVRNHADDTFDCLSLNARIAIDYAGSTTQGFHFNIYRPGMGERATRKRMVIDRLNQALKDDIIHLVFQPKISLIDNSIIGAEALIRWEDPDIGQISPLEIIEKAEELQELLYLDQWVYERTCRALLSLSEQGVCAPRISINVSEETLLHQNFSKWVKMIPELHNISSHLIEFEILESAVLKEKGKLITDIHDCQKSGFTFTLDDFGTGYSSLAHLTELPINSVKIDKAFIQHIVHSQEHSAVFRRIIEIGHALGKKVIAEGVENIAQYLIIRSSGCDIIQGFYFSRPVGLDRLSELLQANGGKINAPGMEGI